MLIAPLVAVATGERHYQRWAIVDVQRLANTLLPWSRELPHVITLCWRFPPVAHYSGHFHAVDVPR